MDAAFMAIGGLLLALISGYFSSHLAYRKKEGEISALKRSIEELTQLTKSVESKIQIDQHKSIKSWEHRKDLIEKAFTYFSERISDFLKIEPNQYNNSTLTEYINDFIALRDKRYFEATFMALQFQFTFGEKNGFDQLVHIEDILTQYYEDVTKYINNLIEKGDYKSNDRQAIFEISKYREKLFLNSKKEIGPQIEMFIAQAKLELQNY